MALPIDTTSEESQKIKEKNKETAVKETAVIHRNKKQVEQKYNETFKMLEKITEEKEVITSQLTKSQEENQKLKLLVTTIEGSDNDHDKLDLELQKAKAERDDANKKLDQARKTNLDKQGEIRKLKTNISEQTSRVQLRD